MRELVAFEAKDVQLLGSRNLAYWLGGPQNGL